MIERTSVAEAPAYLEHNDADHWFEHGLRVDLTVALAAVRFGHLADAYRDGPARILDPAAGNGRTARDLAAQLDGAAYTADLAPTAPVDHPARDAFELLEYLAQSTRRFDIVILGEFLEHVEDPARLLELANCVLPLNGGLVVSTPLEEADGVNPEHLWRWDRAGIVELLDAAGFVPLDYLEVDVYVDGYGNVRTQIHTARKDRTP